MKIKQILDYQIDELSEEAPQVIKALLYILIFVMGGLAIFSSSILLALMEVIIVAFLVYWNSYKDGELKDAFDKVWRRIKKSL